jgi:hypothetical protein
MSVQNTIENNMSVFIPAVFKNVSKERVISAFEKVGLGKVSKVHFQRKNEKFNSVYICFSNWRNTESARIFQEKVKTAEGAKLVYDDPWHWIVLEYKPKVEKKIPASNYERYVEVSLSYLTQLQRENNNLKDELHQSEKSNKQLINKFKKLEEQLMHMEIELKEQEHHSKLYIDEIITLKQKITTIEEREDGEYY